MLVKFLTVEEVATILRVSIAKVRQLVSSGEIVSVKVGRQWRISEAALNDYIERQTQK